MYDTLYIFFGLYSNAVLHNNILKFLRDRNIFLRKKANIDKQTFHNQIFKKNYKTTMTLSCFQRKKLEKLEDFQKKIMG